MLRVLPQFVVALVFLIARARLVDFMLYMKRNVRALVVIKGKLLIVATIAFYASKIR